MRLPEQSFFIAAAVFVFVAVLINGLLPLWSCKLLAMPFLWSMMIARCELGR